MTKLEPTRTSSDLTATDRLRELLDERGVGSYTHEAPAAVCLAFFDGKRWHDCWESVGGEVNVTFSMTPEQAIAATLGPAYEQPVAAHWDGDTLTLTIPRDPSCIRVQRSAEQPCKVYADESKIIAATLGAGTCQDLGGTGANNEQVFNCSECGCVLSLYDRDGANTLCTHFIYDYPRYCPECGRKVVEE